MIIRCHVRVCVHRDKKGHCKLDYIEIDENGKCANCSLFGVAPELPSFDREEEVC